MYCRNCGKEIDDKAVVCIHCGVATTEGPKTGLTCPQCGSNNVDVQVIQENLGGKTVTKTKSKYRQKRHGCLWWICIGSWWWIIDLFLWIYLFPIRFLIQLFKKKDYTGKSKSVATTKNKIRYRKMCVCKNCGNTWNL